MSGSPDIPEFVLPEDGWYNIAVRGEWPHRPTGLVQVLDDMAISAIVDAFKNFTAEPNWPGVLIDFDHQSLDQDKPTVAAGWIIALEDRPTGLWAKVRWSDLGRKSIEGGRYRFISPVWKSTDCERLEGDKIRPLKLMNCAVTNEPNIKGLFPLSNAAGSQSHFAPPPVAIEPAPPGPQASAQHGAEGPSIPLQNRTAMDDDQRKAMFARMGGGGGGGGGGGSSNAPDWNGPRITREHEARISSYDRQIQELEASRQSRPVRGDYSMRDWRETRDRMMREGASPTDILKAIAADKAHNKQVRDQLSKIRRDLKKVYKDPAARERAYQRRMDHETRMHEQAVREWEKSEDRITREIRQIERRRDEEVAKSMDSELKAQSKEADRELKISMQNQRLFARAALEAEKTARQQATLAAREQRRVDEANERARRAAQTQEESSRREALRMDPVNLERYEQQRVKSYWSAVKRGDWQSAQRLYPEADHASVRREIDTIRQAGSSDRGRAAMLLNELTSTAPAGAYSQQVG